MKFTYRLSNIGWADVHLQIGKSEIYICPSYVSEPLIDLVRSMESLLPECALLDELESVVQFEWDSEPALYCWRIEKTLEEKVQIKITVYEDGIKGISGVIAFCEECDLKQFIREIVLSMDEILRNHGIIGYRRQWYAQDFPFSSYLQLKYYLLNNNSFPMTVINPDEWIERVETNIHDELELVKKSVK